MRWIFLLSALFVQESALAAVCYAEGKVTTVTPSAGVTGITMDADLGACACDHNVLWIDTETHGGRAMFSAALAAKSTSSQVQAVFEDGKGQGAPGNTSITYRYWPTCQLKAFEVK